MKPNSYFPVLSGVRVRATGQHARVEARQSGVYRISLPGGSTRLVHHNQLMQYVQRKQEI